MDINQLDAFHIIGDEYGNFYEIMGLRNEKGILKTVKLAHIYHETAFSRLLNTEDEKEEYKNKHIGVFLQDLFNNKIDRYIEKHGQCFTIKDLLENDIQVEIMDIRKRHPRSNPIK